MEVGPAREIFFVLLAALSGGVLVRFLKLQPIVGYILAGIIFSLFSIKVGSAAKLAEIGAILLLFSVGIEVSLNKLSRVVKVAVLGGILQIIISTSLVFILLSALGIGGLTGFILAFGFSLSSTAMVVKILTDKGEEATLHGEIMIGWLLVQDLAVIPIMVILPSLALFPGSIFASIGIALLKAGLVVGGTLILGKLIAPYLIHKIAAINSRELLVLSAMTLALGTAFMTSLFGISPALGAFLAGVVISESQENHAVFSETRPLRDIFVALFFVSLGFLVSPAVIVAKFGLILLLALVVMVVKLLVVFLLAVVFGYHGKTAISVAFGLSQIGEFAFIIFSLGLALGLLPPDVASIGIATTLLTLIVTPFLFKSINPVWNLGKGSGKLFSGWGKSEKGKQEYSGHIIICGFGRVGGWVGKALEAAKIPFVVVDYNQTVISDLKKQGIEAIYGDPTESEVIDAAGLKNAKAVVLAIPDEVAQETIIAHVQSVAPSVKLISRVHRDEAWEKLKILKVDKLVQPEFEAAISIIRTILVSSGRSKAEINERTKSIRLSRARS
jgi:CPA2 family monovalent cation:H+ antiporter-2